MFIKLGVRGVRITCINDIDVCKWDVVEGQGMPVRENWGSWLLIEATKYIFEISQWFNIPNYLFMGDYLQRNGCTCYHSCLPPCILRIQQLLLEYIGIQGWNSSAAIIVGHIYLYSVHFMLPGLMEGIHYVICLCPSFICSIEVLIIIDGSGILWNFRIRFPHDVPLCLHSLKPTW